METTITYRKGVQFEIEARGHRIICDQPVENHGDDGGMSPPELLLGALGSCAAYYAAAYLGARNLAAEDLRVHVRGEKALRPARMSSFSIDIDLPEQAAADPRHREGILRAVKNCLIHNTLLSAPAIEVNLHAAVTI